ncbi:MAG: hypothetical protein GXY14_11465 [Spirochaetes bacterium]|nr:hypothetical protein [Spirochaetota bacterium]
MPRFDGKSHTKDQIDNRSVQKNPNNDEFYRSKGLSRDSASLEDEDDDCYDGDQKSTISQSVSFQSSGSSNLIENKIRHLSKTTRGGIMHFIKLNKGIWQRTNDAYYIQLSDDLYLNVNALSSFSFNRLETDISGVQGIPRADKLEKWKHYIFTITISGMEDYFSFIIPVTEDQLIKKIESLMDNAV